MNANLCSSRACSPGPCPRRDMPCGLRTLLPASPSPSIFCSVPPPPAPTGGLGKLSHRWGRAGTGPPSPSSWPRLLLSPVENSRLPDRQQWAGRPDHGAAGRAGARAAAAGHTSPSSSTSDSKLGSELKNGQPDPDGFLEEVASGSCSDDRDPGRVAGRTEPVVPARSVKGASAQARGPGSRWRVTAGGAGGAPADGRGAGLSSWFPASSPVTPPPQTLPLPRRRCLSQPRSVSSRRPRSSVRPAESASSWGHLGPQASVSSSQATSPPPGGRCGPGGGGACSLPAQLSLVPFSISPSSPGAGQWLGTDGPRRNRTRSPEPTPRRPLLFLLFGALLCASRGHRVTSQCL